MERQFCNGVHCDKIVIEMDINKICIKESVQRQSITVATILYSARSGNK